MQSLIPQSKRLNKSELKANIKVLHGVTRRFIRVVPWEKSRLYVERTWGRDFFCFLLINLKKKKRGKEMIIGNSININFNRVWEWWPTFLDGTIVTIVLSLTTVFIGSLIGLLVVLMKMSDFKILKAFASIYTNIVRGTPVLLQLFLWLYGFPMLGISFTGLKFLGGTYGSREFITAVVALAINSGAYVSEILRGGLEAVDKGQIEAGRALGLSQSETMFSVIIPQAIRTVLPGLGNEFITMIKESSIVSTVGVFDVMYTSNIVKASSYSIFEPLIIVGVIYYALTYSLSYLMKRLEKRLNTYA